MNSPGTSASIRTHLLSALHADLIGPFNAGSDGAEVLPLAPSRFYLTGFLAPDNARDPGDPTQDDTLGEGDDDEDDEHSEPTPEPRQKKLFPASIGLSVLLKPPTTNDAVQVTVRYANYDPANADEVPEGRSKPPTLWQRYQPRPVTISVPLDPAMLTKGMEIPGAEGLWLEGRITETTAPGLGPGTRALALFLINRRPSPANLAHADMAFVFQVSMEVRHPAGLCPRPNRRNEGSGDLDDSIADLQFRDRVEWAVGHGVSGEPVTDADGRVVGACTVWLPRAEVRRVVSHDVEGVPLGMEEIADTADAATLRNQLTPLVDAYATWIAAQRAMPLKDTRHDTRDRLMKDADAARRRIREGLDLLTQHPDLFRAFQLANRAMAMQARKRDPKRYETDAPRWRMFQLAFILLNLAGLNDPKHDDRKTVELIFFPTGGGKTEAYLGVIAVLLVLRRLRGRARPDGGYGVAVLLRYTLRLLTLDQLARAASLVCALELLRRDDPDTLGDVRFSVGLWVGRTATANTLHEVGEKITLWKNQRENKKAPSPLPLTQCPWCGAPLDPDGVSLVPDKANPVGVRVLCMNFRTCEFSRKSHQYTADGLPLVFVDEQVYRELPSFLVATVDKFAMIPWRAEAGMLFGRVHSREGRRFFGPPDGPIADRHATLVPGGLVPPELIVQDELHLISGPLGTMVGLYETAIEALCAQTLPDGTTAPPKIISSTATVRRARRQIQSLFGREEVCLFPPPGMDEGETFFARMDNASDGRIYLGVAAGGRAMKAVLLRVYVTLLAAGWKHPGIPPTNEHAADPYTTVVGYFNALRELGGMRRLVEDEVHRRCLKIEERRPVGESGPHPWFRRRELKEPVELTSRETTSSIARSRARLGLQHTAPEHVDVLLASNMISVGVDIDRLGLMVVAGQPKTTSEYIQATSRVGRDVKRPGLVVTALNLHKARDRSHYERFRAYHESFYRYVEATSLTPFSAPALERGLAGVLLAMARHGDPALQPSDGVMDIEAHRAAMTTAVETLAQRAGREHLGLDAAGHTALVETLRQRGTSLLDSLAVLVHEAQEGAGARCWSPFDPGRKGKPVLFTVLDTDAPATGTDNARFAAPTSMRDVEGTTHLWVERKALRKGA